MFHVVRRGALVLLVALTATVSSPSGYAKKPAPTPARQTQADPTVSANTKTHVYHLAGCRYYGKGKNVVEMKEGAAKKAGYRLCKFCEKKAAR